MANGTAEVAETAAAHLGSARIEHTRIRIERMQFDRDRVLPAVAEVVEIDEFLRADVFEDVVEASFACIKEVAGPVRIGIGRAEADVAGADFIESGCRSSPWRLGRSNAAGQA